MLISETSSERLTVDSVTLAFRNMADDYPEGHSRRYWRKHPEALRKAKEQKATPPLNKKTGQLTKGDTWTILGVVLGSLFAVVVPPLGVRIPIFLLVCCGLLRLAHTSHWVTNWSSWKRTIVGLATVAICALISVPELVSQWKQTTAVGNKAEPPPIEVTLGCSFEQLPIIVSPGQIARIVTLDPAWPLPIAKTIEMVNTNGSSPKQWPDDDLLKRLSGNDRSVSRCDLTNHANRDVVEMTVPFYAHFGTNTKTRWHRSSVLVNPLDTGTTARLYFVNPCPVVAEFSVPKTGAAKFAGEPLVRAFSFELKDRWPSGGGEFWPSSFDWSGSNCSPEVAVKSEKDENEPGEMPLILPPGFKPTS